MQPTSEGAAPPAKHRGRWGKQPLQGRSDDLNRPDQSKQPQAAVAEVGSQTNGGQARRVTVDASPFDGRAVFGRLVKMAKDNSFT